MTDSTNPLLSVALSAAVPLWADQIRQQHYQDWDYIRARAAACAQDIASHGDNILYRSTKKGATAEAFNRLAEGVACASFAPGGITIFGSHWEHQWLTSTDRPAR